MLAEFRGLYFFLPVCVLLAAEPPATPVISGSNLRKHVEYLASDKLQGRGNPSPGLDEAAKYIAKEFRKIGLEPVGDHDYFQTATMSLLVPDIKHYDFRIEGK